MTIIVHYSFLDFGKVMDILRESEIVSYSYRYVEKMRNKYGKPIYKNNGKLVYESILVPITTTTFSEALKKTSYFETMSKKGKLKEVVFETSGEIDYRYIIHF